MLTLRLLAGLGLTDSEGREIEALLRQPKHAALLAYLALPKPGTWHRRDTILATFWPETDQSRARSSLRSALHTLRGHLPEGVIVARGDEELSISPQLLTTDVADITTSFDQNRFADALNAYRGELLPAMYVEDSPAFDKWLETERSRVGAIARKSASHLSHELEKRGDLTGAIDAARRGYELDPDDEAAARRWIALLDRAGDRSQAFAVYERFRNHMFEAFGVRPSAETVALLDAIRTRRDVIQPASIASSQAATTIETARTRGRWIYTVTAVAIVALVFIGMKTFRRPKPHAVEPVAVAMLRMQNDTGDPALDYLTSGIAEGIARRLSRVSGLEVHLGPRLRSETLVRTVLGKISDSLEIAVTVADTSGAGARQVTARRFTMQNIADAEIRLTTDIAGAVLRKPIPQFPRTPNSQTDPESYDLTLKGWYALLANAEFRSTRTQLREYRAQDLFNRAIAIDATNARAWSGLSSAWASLSVIGEVPFDEGFERVSASALHAIAIDSLEGSAWANLGLLRGLRNRDLKGSLQMIDRGLKAEPSNPEIYLIRSNLLRSAHRYDEAREAIRMAHALDPLSTVYLNQRATVEFCTDRPAEALKLFEEERRTSPDNVVAIRGSIRALAMLGRYAEAAALWRRQAESARNARLVRELAGVRDSIGYWNVKHADGRARVAELKKENASKGVQLAYAWFAAGEPDSGYRVIDEMPAADRPPLYRITCTPSIDEYRHTPRFRAAAERIAWVEPH